jgi:Ca-activated chloride channel homolog
VILGGLPFATLATIFGIVGGGVVVLYILKLRRRVVAVPFSPLWERVLRDKEATSLFSKLKRLLSLLMQLVLLLCLVSALGDPRRTEDVRAGRATVILLDTSASMQATDVSPNRLEAAKAKVRARLRAMGGNDRMLIATMSATVTPLGPMGSDAPALERLLDDVQPTEARADFPRALRFATDTLRGVSNAVIDVVSDGGFEETSDLADKVNLGGAELAYEKVGVTGDNVGITQFSVRRYPLDKSRYEVMLEITNSASTQADIELSLFGDGTLVDLTKLRLKPGERLPRFYPNLSGASRTLEARISALEGTKDDLPADDRAYALLPERRRAKILDVTEGNTYLEAALLLDEYLDVTDATPKTYAKKIAATKYDIVIFDGVTPADPPNAHAIYLNPGGPGSPVKVGDEIKEPGFDKLDRKHPILRYTALDDVNIAVGHKLTPEAGDKVVGQSDTFPILVAGTRKGNKFVALGFDVRDSDFPLRLAWPLFLMNSINWFMDEDANYLSSFRTGDVWRIPVPGNASSAELKLPNGTTERVPVYEGRAVYLGERAGFYELSVAADTITTPQPDESPGVTAFAANLLDARESAIAPLDKLIVDGAEAVSVDVAEDRALGKISIWDRISAALRQRDWWVWALFVALLITSLEWASYHRRLTV